MNPGPLRVMFLTRTLEAAGAERQLACLASGLHRRGSEIQVLSMYAGGPLEEELRRAGVSVVCLQKRHRWDVAGFVWRLVETVRAFRPHVLHSYLVTPNVLSALLGPALGGVRIVWGVRASDAALFDYGWFARGCFRLSCALSGRPDAIIVNSRSGFDYHRSAGYPAGKMIVIPNGVDLERFRPIREARPRLLREWGLSEESRLVGLVARIDPIKDHGTFLEAASRLAKDRPELQFVCIGGSSAPALSELQARTAALGLTQRVTWTGARRDMAEVYSALDVMVSSSVSEGFSNTLVEAMACGVPCVATRVGDSAFIVGDWGRTVPPRDPVAMAAAVKEVLEDASLSPAAVRASVEERFSLERMVAASEEVLSRVAGAPV